MPRGKLPTGGKPGRKTLAETMAAELGKSKSAAARALRKHILEHEGNKPTAMVKLAQAAVGEVAESLGQPTTYKDLSAPMELTGDTAEEIGKSAVQELVGRLHAQIAPVLAKAIQHGDADKVIKTYLELIQYVLPKLSKQEVSGSVSHKVATFVPVEQRPSLQLKPGPDGVHRVVLDQAEQ